MVFIARFDDLDSLILNEFSSMRGKRSNFSTP